MLKTEGEMVDHRKEGIYLHTAPKVHDKKSSFCQRGLQRTCAVRGPPPRFLINLRYAIQTYVKRK